jgi:hypothetical protein
MFLQYIVVDDFFENPEEVRRLALATDYVKDPHTPNYTSTQKFNPPSMYEVMGNLIGVPVHDSGLDFSGKFRITMKDAVRERDIHIDHPEWNAIIYLNLPKQCEGGTSLWKHKATGWDEVPSEAHAKEAGFPDLHQAMHTVLGKDGVDRSRWEEIVRIPMKFNRLVIIRSTLFHSSFNDFGDSFENARLVQTFFLDRKR